MNVRIEYRDQFDLPAVTTVHSVDRIETVYDGSSDRGDEVTLLGESRDGGYETIRSFDCVQRMEITG